MVRSKASIVVVAGISMLIMASTLLISQSRIYGQEVQVGKFTADLQPRAGSNATGKVILQALPDLKTIWYSINASGLKDVTNVAISQETTAGRLSDVVIIHTSSGQGIMQGAQNGTIATGNFTASEFSGALEGKRMADFVKAIGDGKIVVRVASSAYPLGELAGKLSIS